MFARSPESRGSRLRSLALIYDNLSSFVRRDVTALSDDFKIRQVWYRGKRDLPALARSVLGTSLNVSWFALGYAYSAAILSRTFGKQNAIIAGGWDVAYEPEIGYGAMSNASRIRMTTKALNSASLVLAVSEACRRDVLQWVSREVHVVPNGVDTNLFSPLGDKSRLVVTVANIDNAVKFRLKGIEVLVETAARLPGIPFRLVGRVSPSIADWIHRTAPRNLQLLGWLGESDLINELRRAKVYFQPSFRESFGVAVIEAMSCCCVPVVSRRKALPEVIGNTGFVCEYGDVNGTVEAIQAALESRGARARARVQERFSIEERRNRLVRLLGSLE